MKFISLLIKPVSSNCNLDCRYCFYKQLVPNRENVKKKMSQGVMKKIIDNVAKDMNSNDIIEFAFQGGEPALAGLDFYRGFIEYVEEKLDDKVDVKYSFQTNGMLLTEEWCDFFLENDFLVGLSIDGPQKIHDLYRKKYNGEGSFEKVILALELLKKYNVSYNVLTVVTENLAKYPDEMWDFIIENDIENIQFINCMEFSKNDSEKYLKNSLERGKNAPAMKADFFEPFYSNLFVKWLEALKNGRYRSINLFDQLFRYVNGDRGLSCSFLGRCTPQYMVEYDGSAYPCDFFKEKEYLLGNLTKETLKELFMTDRMQFFLTKKKELPFICSNCAFRKMCNGGCKKQIKTFVKSNGKYCGYRDFLEKNMTKLTGCRI